MEKKNTTLEIGHTYYSGNCIYPTHDKMLGYTIYEQLPPDEQLSWGQIAYDLEPSTLFVIYGRNGSIRYSPLSVFRATRYPDHDTMVSAYTATHVR